MLILRIEDIKNICNDILNAVDSNDASLITDTLEMEVKNKTFFMSVTNREYYAQVKLPLFEDVSFHATVNAHLFLKLISNTTTDTVQFDIEDNNLVLRGNGEYRLPLIYEDAKLLTLPEITIQNVTSSFNIDSGILKSIYQYNSKELVKNDISRPVQKMYYIDEQGAITFTNNSACVNEFTLEKPVRLLFNQKLVKLFKLFKGNVKFTLGQDMLEDFIQTKVCFETESFKLTAILNNDESMLTMVPATVMREKALGTYMHSVVFNRKELLQSIKRLQLFRANDLKPLSIFKFCPGYLRICDVDNSNFETIKYANESNIAKESYEATLSLLDLKLSLENCTDDYITLNFGDHEVFVLAKPGLYTVIAEAY